MNESNDHDLERVWMDRCSFKSRGTTGHEFLRDYRHTDLRAHTRDVIKRTNRQGGKNESKMIRLGRRKKRAEAFLFLFNKFPCSHRLLIVPEIFLNV